MSLLQGIFDGQGGASCRCGSCGRYGTHSHLEHRARATCHLGASGLELQSWMHVGILITCVCIDTTCLAPQVMLQVGVVPAYALTVHKTQESRLHKCSSSPCHMTNHSSIAMLDLPGIVLQALSIKHIVRGCLEGVVAFGQVNVLISRCSVDKTGGSFQK